MEKSIEVHDAAGQVSPGACWGTWSISEAACSKCVIAKRCEEATKKKNSGEEPEPDEQDLTGEPLAESSPLDYMLSVLEGKYDHQIEENDKAVANYFKLNDEVVISVAVSKVSGKIAIVTPQKRGSIDRLDSIEQVEEILKRMLG